MVELGTLDDQQLLQIVEEYPWFTAARCEYAERCGDDMRRTGIFLLSRSEWLKIKKDDRRHLPAAELAASVAAGESAPENIAAEKPVAKPEYYVVGGDYFGKEDFQQLEQNGLAFETPAFSPVAGVLNVEEPLPKVNSDNVSSDDICTETLAEIYVEQEFYQRAIEVYEKLILLYPEKSAYFATLIEKVKNLN